MKNSVKGFSLIELMVAITLSLVLFAGVATVFVNTKQGYRVQESVGRLQENARYGSSYLTHYIRLADFWGGVKSNKVTVLPAGTATGGGAPGTGTSCAATTFVVDPADPLIGYQGDNAGAPLSAPANLPSDCISSSNPYIPGSDALAIRFVDPDSYTANLSSTSSTTNGTYYLRTQVGSQAYLFDVTGSGLGTATTAFPANTNDYGILNFEYQTMVFFLGNFNSGQGLVPTLYVRSLQNSSGASLSTAQPVADGIEMMKFDFGLDTTGMLQTVNQYKNASQMAATDWANVISVRVSFIARGDTLDTYQDTGSYVMNGAGYVYTPAASVQKYQRRLIVNEIQIRNRVRGAT